MDPNEGPGCLYIRSTDTWEHDQQDCPSSYSERELNGPCPLESEEKNLRCLTIMEGLWYLTHCFHDPSMGAQQKSLNLEPDVPLILRYRLVCGLIRIMTLSANAGDRDFKSIGNYQPRDAIFHGLLLRERGVGSMFVVSGVMFEGLVSLVTMLLTLLTSFWSNDFNIGLSAGNLFVNWISTMHYPRRPKANPAHHNSWYGKEGGKGE